MFVGLALWVHCFSPSPHFYLSLSFSTFLQTCLTASDRNRLSVSILETYMLPALHFLSHNSTHVIVIHANMLSQWCFFLWFFSLWVSLTFHHLCTLKLERLSASFHLSGLINNTLSYCLMTVFVT